jgi:predicted RNA-binding Zn-ribbon protein involved in translation (DUF1610 family)
MSGKKKTLTEKLKEAEKRAFDAEFDLKLLRGKDGRACEEFKQMAAALANERDRARTLQFMVNAMPTIAAYDFAIREVHTLKCIVMNLFNAKLIPVFVACPKCGVVAIVPPEHVSQVSGYRLCPKCLASMEDPWLKKPDEYALATKGDDR